MDRAVELTYTIRPADPKPAKFTRRVRPDGAKAIHQIQIHATRGPTANDLQVQATENWFAQQPDRGGWGSSADFVIGHDRRENGEIVIVEFGDWLRTFGSWSAGYGSNSTQEYGAAELGVAIEVGQRSTADGYSEETIAGLVWLCRQINDRIVDAGGKRVPPQRIEEWNQRRDAFVPRGYIGHEDLANGKKLGKTDPGSSFPWDDFLGRLDRAEPTPPHPEVIVTKAGMDGRDYLYDLRVKGS